MESPAGKILVATNCLGPCRLFADAFSDAFLLAAFAKAALHATALAVVVVPECAHGFLDGPRVEALGGTHRDLPRDADGDRILLAAGAGTLVGHRTRHG